VSAADRAIRVAAGAAVVALAMIAAAVSYSHMRLLAERHGETGWRAHAFPLSVDGIEIVASLVLLANRRVARRSAWLVWAALSAGTAASMAANIAVGATDPIGRVVAGWPAFALLVAIKLLSGLIDHPSEQSGAVPRRSATEADSGPTTDGPGTRPVPANIAELLPAARAVQRVVAEEGRSLTRGLLAERLRQQGITISNARLSTLLRQVSGSADGTPSSAGD
jgi:uncharacterized protein DUF2637